MGGAKEPDTPGDVDKAKDAAKNHINRNLKPLGLTVENLNTTEVETLRTSYKATAEDKEPVKTGKAGLLKLLTELRPS